MKINIIITGILFLSLISCNNEILIDDTITIIPEPVLVVKNEGYFVINKNTSVNYSETFSLAANYLHDYLENGTGFSLLKGQKTGNTIEFIEDTGIVHDEGYVLHVSEESIQIKAKSPQGAFYAVQSLRQLLPKQLELDNKVATAIGVPNMKITDYPRFSYRGMHLDVGRHFYSIDFIKKYIDMLALLKMNTFHWHLTEDQGWRIEIKKYPKLTTHAAYRKETLVGHYNDQPHQFDGKRYGGFYTQEEVKEVVNYASKLGVTIIPEIEMPGHSQAAISAYPELGCTGEQVEVATKWGVFEEVYCPSEKTFQFLEDVIDEVVALFPSKYIHIGGDEAPKTRWKNCDYCQQLIKELDLKDEHGLQSYFISRMEKYINSKGKQIIGWDEILEGGLAPNATVMSWRGINGAIEAAKEGHDVIMTPTSHCYFDYYQSDDENEPLAIGGYLPLEKVYNFEPIPEELTKEQEQFVLGAQGNVWTEYMPNSKQVEYMTFPRAMALSEVLWSPKENKEYASFLKRLEVLNNRLAILDVNYANHLYDIDGSLEMKQHKVYYSLTNEVGGKDIRYTTDGTDPTSSSLLYQEPIAIEESSVIKALTFEDSIVKGKLFEQKLNFHKGVGKSITINKEPHKAYSGSGAKGLLNSIKGSDKRFGDKEWLGFWGEDLEITIDLGEMMDVNTLQLRFFNANGQWIYAPEKVEISFFIGFKEVRVRPKETLFNDKGMIRVFDIELNLPPTDRLILRIPRYGIIPEGLQGSGNEAWTFIDEIQIW